MNKSIVNKVKIIELLATTLKIHSEKALTELNIENLLDSKENLTITQLRDIRKLKKAVKENRLFSFLTEDIKKELTSNDDQYS